MKLFTLTFSGFLFTALITVAQTSFYEDWSGYDDGENVLSNDQTQWVGNKAASEDLWVDLDGDRKAVRAKAVNTLQEIYTQSLFTLGDGVDYTFTLKKTTTKQYVRFYFSNETMSGVGPYYVDITTYDARIRRFEGGQEDLGKVDLPAGSSPYNAYQTFSYQILWQADDTIRMNLIYDDTVILSVVDENPLFESGSSLVRAGFAIRSDVEDGANDSGGYVSTIAVTAIPEPGQMAMLLGGAVIMAAYFLRRIQRTS